MSQFSQNEYIRPNPDELLDRYQLRDSPSSFASCSDDKRLHSRKLGRLRVYLGMAPGVGKTYAMLNEGRRRKTRGADVVIGYIETHHRPITEEQIGDLEIIPRKHVLYREIALQEMDIDAIMKRHPQVVLVDELAHTNVPGSYNTKRYQDVETLLQAGIIVITTLNIQHLESLNDIIESITGIRQRETLPDLFLDKADEVELIDITPDALRSRMRHGNVYPLDRVNQALQQYFTLSNLTALRELALRCVAAKTEDQLEMMTRKDGNEHTSAWGRTATERVMVAFDGRLHSKQLLRVGWRLAHGLRAPILAVTIESKKYYSGLEKTFLKDAIYLAEELGIEVIRVQGKDIATKLAETAREYHATQIVIGQPMKSKWEELRWGSVVNRLLRLSTGADIHIVPYI